MYQVLINQAKAARRPPKLRENKPKPPRVVLRLRSLERQTREQERALIRTIVARGGTLDILYWLIDYMERHAHRTLRFTAEVEDAIRTFHEQE